MRILLVEDDLDLGDALVTGLKQYKYSVDWLKDGQSALQVLKCVVKMYSVSVKKYVCLIISEVGLLAKI